MIMEIAMGVGVLAIVLGWVLMIGLIFIVDN